MTGNSKSRKRRKAKYGIVAMIDVLGVRSASIQVADSLLKSLAEIEKALPIFMEQFLKQLGEKVPEAQIHYEKYKPNLRIIGDTVVVSWEMERGKIPRHILFPLQRMLGFLMVYGLKAGLPFRGAVSVGEFVCTKRSIVGPVIGDVAAWYEAADWLGVIATPHFGHYISETQCNKDVHEMLKWHLFKQPFDHYFLRYDVPMKDGSKHSLWSIPWPNLVSAIGGTSNPLAWYYEQVQRFSIPKSVEIKYANTETYVMKVLGSGKPTRDAKASVQTSSDQSGHT